MSSAVDETRMRVDAERRLLWPRDDAEAGCAQTSLRPAALTAALETADLSCAVSRELVRPRRSALAKRPARGEQQETCQLSHDTRNADGAVILHGVRRSTADVPDQPAPRLRGRLLLSAALCGSGRALSQAVDG